MNNNLEEIILQAIDIVASKKIASAGYDKTILATIVSCQDEKIGKYKVKYQDSYWYAYSNNINITYSNGSNVYVLIPKGDMKQDKTILGGVRQLGVNYKNIAGEEQEIEQQNTILNGKPIYILNGENLIQTDNVWSLSSYKTETKVLYSKDLSDTENLIYINKENAKEYIQKSSVLAVSMDVQTMLNPQQRYEGNYGILIGLDFKDNALGETVTRYYTIDVDSMTGNPYYYPNIINQSQTFDIDGQNFEQINLISLFTRDFPNQDNTKNDDIFISNLQIGGAFVLSENDLLSYSLNIITPKGYIFNANSSNDEERKLQAQLRSKGKVVNFETGDIALYWFVENTAVTTKNQKYSKYGGQGWECLNEYGIIQQESYDADGELVNPDMYGFLPATTDTYSVKKSEILAKDVRFKCVVVYNSNILSKEISILRTDSEYDIYITSNAGTSFYYDSGSPTLTCYCKHKENDGSYSNVDIQNLKFVWSLINNTGNFSSLESLASQNQDKNKLILIKNSILKYINISYIVNTDVFNVSEVFPSTYKIADLEDGELKNKVIEIREELKEGNISDQGDILSLFNQYDIEMGNAITYSLLLNGDSNHKRTLTNAIKNYNRQQKIVNNQIINLNIRGITKFATFKCSVFTKMGNQFLGTAAITLTNSLFADNQYSLIINNGTQLFKYNTHGISPTSKRLNNPQEIPLLGFSIYDEAGNKIDDEIANRSQISWTIPTVNTMLKANSSYSGGIPNSDFSTMTYENLVTFGYTILESYNIRKTNNDIQLKVVYNGMTLTATTNLIFTKEGEEGTNGTQFTCKIVPNVQSGDMPLNPTIFYDGTDVSFNWDQNNDKPWFKVQLWHNDSEPIFSGTSTGLSTEDKLVVIDKWEVLKNVYKKSVDEALAVSDETNFSITSNTSSEGWTFRFLPEILRNSWNEQEYKEWRPANILKVTISYDGNIYYGTLPIIVSRLFDGNKYRVKLKDYTGFNHVLYSSGGVDPSYDSHAPFEIITQKFEDGKWNDISTNQGLEYNFFYTGSVWYKQKDENNHYTWVEEVETTNERGESSKRWLKKRYIGSDNPPINQKAIQPVQKYNGECVNTALVCEVSRVYDGQVLAWLHIPIHFTFNRFENSAINGWDGNSVDLGAENGGTILAPQAGMGYKDENNRFTGVVMGTSKDPDADTTNETGSKSNEEAGLFAYHQGVRTAFIDAKTGKSTFGQEGQAQIILDPTQTNEDGRKVAQIKSGNYNEDEETGLMIDLSTPQIKYGSGNFHVDKDGRLYARGATIEGYPTEDNIQTMFEVNNDQILSTVSQKIYADYTGEEIPTNENYPANEWTTDKLKEEHKGSVYRTEDKNYYKYVSKDASGLKINFNSNTNFSQYSYLVVYFEENGILYRINPKNSQQLAGNSIIVPAKSFIMTWSPSSSSASAANDYGFSIDSIEKFKVQNFDYPEVTQATQAQKNNINKATIIELSGDTYPESNHPASVGNKVWKYTPEEDFSYIAYYWEETDEKQMGSVTSMIRQSANEIRLKADSIVWDSKNSTMTEQGVFTCFNLQNNNIKTEIMGGKMTSYGQLPIYETSDGNKFTVKRKIPVYSTYEDSIISFYNNRKPIGAIAEVPIYMYSGGIERQTVVTEDSTHTSHLKEKDITGLTITSVGCFTIDIGSKVLPSYTGNSFYAKSAYVIKYNQTTYQPEHYFNGNIFLGKNNKLYISNDSYFYNNNSQGAIYLNGALSSNNKIISNSLQSSSSKWLLSDDVSSSNNYSSLNNDFSSTSLKNMGLPCGIFKNPVGFSNGIVTPTLYTKSIEGSAGHQMRMSTYNTVTLTMTGVDPTFIVSGITVQGHKNRVIYTKNYDERLFYSYETPEPMFGDLGQGQTDDLGIAVIDIDDIFQECVQSQMNYYVFLQPEGEGNLWVEQKKYNYFIVKGTSNLKFSWEIKRKQIDFRNDRLERMSNFNLLDYYDTQIIKEELEKSQIEEVQNIIEKQEENYNETIKQFYGFKS